MSVFRLAVLLLLPVSAGSLLRADAQRSRDALSPAEIDQVRELGDRPNDRIKLLLEFVDRRVAAVQEITPDSTENNRPAQLHERYEQFTRLSDELTDNIDTYDGDHADIRKGLTAVLASSEKWPAVLQGPPPNDAYDFERTTALDAARDMTAQVKKDLDSEKAYFATHKKEAGKNGKAPSPES